MAKMLAMTIPNRGERFRKEEREMPAPGRHQVRIRVQACAFAARHCHDRSSCAASVSTRSRHEVIGVIDALGPGSTARRPAPRGVGWSSGASSVLRQLPGNSFAVRTCMVPPL